jgi:2-keto-4-pentenoate hydratase/2-oxohepta-3-ene-1,7-dioic acid hydratase in catechol pathway
MGTSSFFALRKSDVGVTGGIPGAPRRMNPSDIVRFARYDAGGRIHFGRVDGASLVRMDAAPWEGGRETTTRDELSSVRLLAPCVPTKIVCVGLNYVEHIAESQSVAAGLKPGEEPLLFLKPPSAVIADGDPIVYPPGVERLDPEGEVAVVIGRRACRVSEALALDHIAGYACFNDVSARNYQRQDGQWTRAKGFDTFAPLGPVIARGLDPAALVVECRVNGARRQRGSTSDLRFPVPYLIRHISHIMTLEPGDVIATGTPAGVAPIEPGDVVEVEIAGIGILHNRVENRS